MLDQHPIHICLDKWVEDIQVQFSTRWFFYRVNDLCDVQPTLSRWDITWSLSGNFICCTYSTYVGEKRDCLPMSQACCITTSSFLCCFWHRPAYTTQSTATVRVLYRQASSVPTQFQTLKFPDLSDCVQQWPSEVQGLVLCIFSRLLLLYSDFFPSPFCYNMHWMCKFIFFNKNKQQSITQLGWYTSFSLTINKIPGLSLTK